MSKKPPTVEEVLGLLDQRNAADVGGNELLLQKKYGLDNLVSVYVEAFPQIKNWAGRMHIMFYLPRFARSNQQVVEVARLGLNDRSRIVRTYSCEVLAYSLDPESIPFLEQILDHRDETTRGDAAAAINAIYKQNHHLWVDRKETGRYFWVVQPGDDPRGILMPKRE